jgi:hypothetical protein
VIEPALICRDVGQIGSLTQTWLGVSTLNCCSKRFTATGSKCPELIVALYFLTCLNRILGFFLIVSIRQMATFRP